MKKDRASIWQQSGSFWVGAGFIAEVPFWLVAMFAPAGSCEATIGQFTSCPPPLWFIITAAIIAYFAVAAIAHRMGA